MNNVSGITFPAPSLCSSLGLVNHGESLDLWQPSGRQATVYRELDVGKDASGSHLLYLRTDLLKAYLVETNQVLAHILWGERNLDHREFDRRPISADHEAAFQSRDNTFGQLVEFK